MPHKEITPTQLMVMECIWNSGREMSYQELIEELGTQYGKDYRRSTVITFLCQLVDKGYLETYRTGKTAYVRPIVTEEEFQQEHAREEVDHWYKGKVSNFLSAFVNSGGIAEEDISEIRKLLDELENN